MMPILSSILGAIALGGGTILEKTVLKVKKINIYSYQFFSFFAITLLMLPFLFFFWKLDSQAFSLKNILILISVVIISIVANLFIFYSEKREKISNLEPAKILEPLFVILLAVLFSFFIDSGLYERNLSVIIPSIIAALALIFSHIESNRLKFNRYFIATIFGSFFFALELVISRLILDFYSPVTFYFLRCLFILIFSYIIFFPKISSIEGKIKRRIFLAGFFWVIYRIAVYYGYIKIGIISTTLIILLGPVFVYLFSWIFLKEKLSWKNIIASVVIISCVLYSLI